MSRNPDLEFSEEVKKAAFARQQGACAFGGENLLAIIEGRDWWEESTDSGKRVRDFNTFNRVYAHHIIPVQSASPIGEGATLARSTDNCVWLCFRCHQWVHGDGNTRSGAMAPPDAFVCSHGPKPSDRDGAARKAWVAKMLSYWDALWDEKQRKYQAGQWRG